MPQSTLGKLQRALEEHLVVDVEVETGHGRRVTVGDRFVAVVTIMNPPRQHGVPRVVYRDLEFSLEGTEYAAPTKNDSGWHCLTCELAPGESVRKSVEMKAIKTHPLGHERFLRIHVRAGVDPTEFFRIAVCREPQSHVKPDVGDDWPASRRSPVAS